MRNGVSEEELVAKATGERVTLADVQAAIISEHYFTALEGDQKAKEVHAKTSVPDYILPQAYSPLDLGLLTICVLRLWNGYTVLGKSACADPVNFNKDLGRRLAREDAVNQIWPLMGFELKSRLVREASNADVS